MGRAMQLVTGFVTAPSTTLTAWTMASGDTLAVRNMREGTQGHLVQMWCDNQGAGSIRVKSPLFHDDTTGITANIVATEVMPLMPQYLGQRIHSQDTLNVAQSGSAGAGDIESGSLLIYYDDVTGAEAILRSPAEVMPRIQHIMTAYNTLSLGTAGGYSGEETIISEINNWKANRDYALLGYLVSAECCSVGWRGNATGNLRIGGPGNETQREMTANWFVYLSQMTGKPCIPVFNTADNSSILIDGVQDENGTDVLVTSFFALLQ